MFPDYLYPILFLLLDLSLQTPLAIPPRNTIHTTPPASPSPTSIKSDVSDCAVRGTATRALLSETLDSTYAPDILSCQLDCELTSRCESWSFYPPPLTSTSTSTSKKKNKKKEREKQRDQEGNCVYYTTYIRDIPRFIKPNSTSNILFSDKYPLDGSNFCFGSPAWGRSGKGTHGPPGAVR